MPIVADGQAPYAPPATVLSIVEGFRDRGLQTPFTLEVLNRAGVSESLGPRTLQSLKLLDLVDADGEPTQAFTGLAKAPEAEVGDRLAAILHSVYQDVFKFVNLDEDDYQRVRDAFRHYKPRGQQERMVTLFLHLCKEAGLTDEILKPPRTGKASKPATNRQRSQPQKKAAAATAPAVSRSAVPPPKPETEFTPSPTPSSGQHPLIRGLIQSLPESGSEWPERARNAWVRAALANFELVYELPPEDRNGGDSSS
jgi:Family of unknown function (DUF5343)